MQIDAQGVRFIRFEIYPVIYVLLIAVIVENLILGVIKKTARDQVVGSKEVSPRLLPISNIVSKSRPPVKIRKRVQVVARPDWRVSLKEHHQGYISCEEFEKNAERLEKNRTNGEETVLSGPAREGLALLQGMLLCGSCGRALTVRYLGNGGMYPTYLCNRLLREGLASSYCMSFRCDLLDAAISQEVLKALQPAEVELALAALHELEVRDQTIFHQWQMRLERAEYEAALAERRYQEVDPSQRLVAATLERRWNEALLRLEDLKKQALEFQRQESRLASPEQKAKILALAGDLPRLWQAPSTRAKDRKRMLRLLIKDITVEKPTDQKQLLVHIRWKGGACTDMAVSLPPNFADRVRYSPAIVEQVRHLASSLTDAQIAERLNEEGQLSALGKPFTVSMIKWIRHRYQIPAAKLIRPNELTVQQVAERFGVSSNVVYYWIEHAVIQARRVNSGMPCWITLDETDEQKLRGMGAQLTSDSEGYPERNLRRCIMKPPWPRWRTKLFNRPW